MKKRVVEIRFFNCTDLMSILGRNDIRIDSDSRPGEELAESEELLVRRGIVPMLPKLGGGLGRDRAGGAPHEAVGGPREREPAGGGGRAIRVEEERERRGEETGGAARAERGGAEVDCSR